MLAEIIASNKVAALIKELINLPLLLFTTTKADLTGGGNWLSEERSPFEKCLYVSDENQSCFIGDRKLRLKLFEIYLSTLNKQRKWGSTEYLSSQLLANLKKLLYF